MVQQSRRQTISLSDGQSVTESVGQTVSRSDSRSVRRRVCSWWIKPVVPSVNQYVRQSVGWLQSPVASQLVIFGLWSVSLVSQAFSRSVRGHLLVDLIRSFNL